MAITSLGGLAIECARAHGSRVARRVKVDGAWKSFTWAEHIDDAIALAHELDAAGIAPGRTVGILGTTRREWELIDLACAMCGGASVGIYPSSTTEQVKYLAKDAGLDVLFAEGAGRWRDALPALKVHDFSDVEQWVARGREVRARQPARIDELIARVQADTPVTLVYTSGTTGLPKGAVLRHSNFLSVMESLDVAMPVSSDDVVVGYLPLAHALQRTTLYRTYRTGCALVFSPSLDALVPTLAETSPTQLSAVPRVLEKIYQRFRAALTPGWDESPPKRDAIAAKVRAVLGGKLQRIYCGGAPLDVDVCRFFHAVGVPVYEAYGLTEVTAVATANSREHGRIGSVGRPIPQVEVRLDPDGEVLIRGPGNFREYWKLPAETAAALTADGWFRTGDLGRIDADGYLFLTGRKKELIVTSGGKKIAPTLVERALMGHPLISQTFVHGDRRPYLVALVTLLPDAARAFVAERGEAALTAELTAHVEKANATLASFEQVKRFAVLPRELDVAHGELTPTLKLVRPEVEASFRAVIEGLYSVG